MEIDPTEFFLNGSNPYRYVLYQGNWIMEMRLSNSDHLLRAARQDAGLLLDIANSCIRQEERLFNGVPLTIYYVDSGKTPTWRWDEQHNRIFGMVSCWLRTTYWSFHRFAQLRRQDAFQASVVISKIIVTKP